MANDAALEPKDEDLVVLCQKGDRQAFEVLVLRYMQKAFRIALDFTRNAEEAKDLSQDAFLRAFTKIKDFDKRSTFYTWFYRIVVNLCLDQIRRKKRTPWERVNERSASPADLKEIADASSAPDEVAMATDVKRKLGKALETMPKNQRTVFLLRNHQGLPISDIAKVMQTTEGTVRVYLHRAIAALRQSLLGLA